MLLLKSRNNVGCKSDSVQEPESRPDPSERSLDDINDFGTDSSSRGFEDEDRGWMEICLVKFRKQRRTFNPSSAATAAYNLNQVTERQYLSR